MTRVTVRKEWDMGHRLPNHLGLCRNLHGHRYVVHVTLAGDVRKERGASDEGMVVDFSDVKRVLQGLVDSVDHKFMLYELDPLVNSMAHMPGVKLVPFVPTAENIAMSMLQELHDVLVGPAPSVRVESVRLYETPTSWADAS